MPVYARELYFPEAFSPSASGLKAVQEVPRDLEGGSEAEAITLKRRLQLYTWAECVSTAASSWLLGTLGIPAED